eukprot:14069427-Alexandrium_andersonii.AAC.1
MLGTREQPPRIARLQGTQWGSAEAAQCRPARCRPAPPSATPLPAVGHRQRAEGRRPVHRHLRQR